MFQREACLQSKALALDRTLDLRSLESLILYRSLPSSTNIINFPYIIVISVPFTILFQFPYRSLPLQLHTSIIVRVG